MKRYKKLVPSTLVLITLMSSVVTETAYAEPNIVNEGEENNIGEITTGSAIEIIASSTIKPKTFGTYEEDGWSYQYDTDAKTARVLTIDSKVGDVVIPSSVTIDDIEYTVTGLDDGLTFENESGLTSIVIPAGVTALPSNGMFNNCVNLKSITIMGNVNRIPNDTFKGCSNLFEINLNEPLSNIGNNAFYECTNLMSIELSNTVTYIGTYAFYNCKSLEEIKFDGSLGLINEYSFSGCESLKKMILPKSAKTINRGAFSGCTQLEEVDASSITYIAAEYTFKDCESLKKVILGNVSVLPPNTFEGCKSLKTIQLPDTLKSIYQDVFTGSGLQYITIPSDIGVVISTFAGTLVSSETGNNILTARIDDPLNGEIIYLDAEAKPLLKDLVGGKTIYMQYDVKPKINLNGGQMGADRTFPAWVTEDKLADYLDTPTRDGETFAGWEIVNAEKLVCPDGVERIVGSVELKAKWKPKNAIFNPNGGTGNQITIAQMVDEKFALPNVEPNREGYKFIGWFDSQENQVNQIDATTVVTNLVDGTVFYAKWEEIVIPVTTVNIVFDVNDGTSNKTTVVQTIGDKFKLPMVNPTREGYEFLGWFDKSGVQITNDMIVDKLEDGVVFYAKWAEKVVEETTINAIFDNNDGTSNQMTIPQTTGEKFILPTVAPTRRGYEFLGWFDAKGTKITEETVVDKLEDGTVFYAKWVKKVVEPIEEPTDNTDNDTDDNTDDSGNTNTTDGNTDTNVDTNLNDDLNTDGEPTQSVDPNKLLFNAFSVKAGSGEFITLYSDGTVKHTNAYAKSYIDPRTKSMYVSLRGVLDNSIDTVKINWDSKTHTAEIDFVDKGTKIVFTANSNIMTVNGVERQMLSGEGEIIEAQLSEGRLMIPLRFVSELFDFNVGYDNGIKRSVVATDRFEMEK